MELGVRRSVYLFGVILMVLILALLLILPIQSFEFTNSEISTKPNHEIWDNMLHDHVDTCGMVDYKGFVRDSLMLKSYLTELSTNPPYRSTWSRNERLAYWINSYNAFTIKLIIDHYPLVSIRDIGSKIQVPFVNSPWDLKFITIGDQKLDLNNIEHNILRKVFDEPRIHFAIVCASMSCPELRNEAYTAARLDEQLDEQAIKFINDPFRNRISVTNAEISKIFQWFKGDFTENGSLAEYLNEYSTVPVAERTKISFKTYDWNLNENHLGY